jgi:hypothetical protein
LFFPGFLVIAELSITPEAFHFAGIIKRAIPIHLLKALLAFTPGHWEASGNKLRIEAGFCEPKNTLLSCCIFSRKNPIRLKRNLKNGSSLDYLLSMTFRNEQYWQ